MSLQTISHSLRGNLTYQSDHERDWDRLTALAWGCIRSDRRSSREAQLSSLGISLIAFRHAHLPSYQERALQELTEALEWRTKGLRHHRRELIARQAIEEWVLDVCPSCLGAGSGLDERGVSRPCVPCGTSGKRRWSDEDRKTILGPQANKLASAIGTAHSLIALSVHIATEFAERMLRR